MVYVSSPVSADHRAIDQFSCWMIDVEVDVVQEFDEAWAKKIQMEKFRWHNSQWLEMVESQHIDDDAVMYGDDSSGGHVFLHDADMLDQSDLYYGAQGTHATVRTAQKLT